MFKHYFKLIKEIVEQLAVSFLFSIVFLGTIYLIIADDLNFCISILNRMTVVTMKQENKTIKLDEVSKRLINYPSYNTIFGTIQIPTINVEAPVYHGDSLDILKNGVGHYAGSYFPGEGASIILAAHNSKKHFISLPKLKKHDIIIIDSVYGKYTYEVTDYKIIKDDDVKSLEIQTEKEILMMYTCYPVATIGYKNKRYVVYAELVEE